jgi:hypothetical protein
LKNTWKQGGFYENQRNRYGPVWFINRVFKKINLVNVAKSVFSQFYWFIEWFFMILKTSTVPYYEMLCAHSIKLWHIEEQEVPLKLMRKLISNHEWIKRWKEMRRADNRTRRGARIPVARRAKKSEVANYRRA